MPSCDWGYAPNCQCRECRTKYEIKDKTSNPAKLTCMLCDSLGTHFHHSRDWFCDTHYIFRKQQDAGERVQVEARRIARELQIKQDRLRREAMIRDEREAKKLQKEKAQLDIIRARLIKKYKIRYCRFVEYRRRDILSDQLYLQEWIITRFILDANDVSEQLDCKRLELEHIKAQRLIYQCITIHPHVLLLQKEFNLPGDMARELTKFIGRSEYYDWYDKFTHGFNLSKCGYGIKSLDTLNGSIGSLCELAQFKSERCKYVMDPVRIRTTKPLLHTPSHFYFNGYVITQNFIKQCKVDLEDAPTLDYHTFYALHQTHYTDKLCPFCWLSNNGGVMVDKKKYFDKKRKWLPQLTARVQLRRQYDMNVTKALYNHDRVLDNNKQHQYNVKINAYLRNPKNAVAAHPETVNFSRPVVVINRLLQLQSCPCGRPLKPPFKLCYTCNMSQKSKLCPCGNPIKATFKLCYKCHMSGR